MVSLRWAWAPEPASWLEGHAASCASHAGPTPAGAEPDDLELAWSQFPAHHEIRARATQVDTVADIVSGWGYRTPKKFNRCSDAELLGLVRGHIDATRPLISGSWDDARAFIEKGYDI